MSITEIIRQGFASGDSYAVINKRLADAGFNIKLVPRENTGWTEQEMKEGFIPAKEEAKNVLTLADLMGRNNDLAGKTVNFWCKEGNYDVTYNENGYAVKAVRKEA